MIDKIIAAIVCLLALIPNDSVSIPMFRNQALWFYCSLIAGTLAFLFLYSKANILIKISLVFLFFTSIFSAVPYFSILAFFWVIISAYFYLLCLEAKSYEWTMHTIQAIFFVNISIIVLQALGMDKLLTFGVTRGYQVGYMANKMVLGSYLLALVPFLLIESFWNFVPAFLACLVIPAPGAAFILGVFGAFKAWSRSVNAIRIIVVILLFLGLVALKSRIENHLGPGGRWQVWKKTVELTNKHPIKGYGIGTFKILYPVYGQNPADGITGYQWKLDGLKGNIRIWQRTHNCFLQNLFEGGYILFGLMLGFFGWLFYGLYKKKKWILFGGLSLWTANMLIFFPTRTFQIVPLLIVFLAICQKEIQNDRSTNC